MDRAVAERRVILKVLVGSHIHGLNVPTSDKDFDAIIVEPIEEALPLGNPFEELVFESPEEDVKYISLRKWCRLALGGNPNFLLPLFAPHASIFSGDARGTTLMDMRGMFISKAAGKAHLGYMHNQRKRMLGQLGNGGHGQQRKDLVEKHGYDTKFGMHLLRLGMQGIEFLSDGRLTLPMKEEDRAMLMKVRRGEIGMEEVLERATNMEHTLEALLESSKLPKEGNREAVQEWMLKTYIRSWGADRTVLDHIEDWELFGLRRD